MATVIFAEQALEGFEYSSAYGAYIYNVNPAPFSLTLGETYNVIWDGVEYSCEAQDMSAMISGTIALGDLSAYGGNGNGEPFLIGSNANGASLLSFDTETSHTLAIYQGEAEEESTGVDIVLKDRNGTDITYPGIKAVKLNTADGGTQTFIAAESAEKTVEADFSTGNMAVKPDAGTLLSKVTVTKPDTLIASNIKNGVEVAGVTGQFIGDTEESTVALNLADGNQVVTPTTAERVLSKVTITKPDTLVPENIVKDVDIAGVIGTFEGGGGGDGGIVEKDVCFYDYDGTLLASYTIEEANALTALPTPPAHDGLTFQEWNHTLEDVQATGYGLDIGATYITDDGTTRLDITLFDSAKLSPTLYFNQTVDGGVLIDWGDGSSETVAGTGNLNVSHTYSALGDYRITMTVADGCVLGFGNGTSSTYLLYGYYQFLKAIYIGNNVTLDSEYSFFNIHGVKELTIPNHITSIGNYCFQTIYSLAFVAFPRGVTSIGSSNCYTYDHLKAISLPKGVKTIGVYFLYSGSSLRRFVVPSSLATLGTDVCTSSYGLEEVVFAKTTTLKTINLRALQNCYKLKKLKIPEGVTSINSSFGNMRNLEIAIFPSTLPTSGLYKTMFGSSPRMLLYVPDSKLSSFQSLSYLSGCKTRIYPVSELPAE